MTAEPPEAPGAPPGMRWIRMRARVEAALSAAGLEGSRVHEILAAHDRAGVHRATLLPPDEDDPRWLHPGRLLVVLLEDVGDLDPRWMTLACGVDQGDPHLMEAAWRRELEGEGFPFLHRGSHAAGAALAGDDATRAWLESVLVLERSGQAVLLVDWLDHLRHLHLRPPGPGRDATVSWARSCLLPLARRFGGTLERRFQWWCTRSRLARQRVP